MAEVTLVTKELLREEIGAPTSLPSAVGRVLDSALEGLIAEYRQALVDGALARVLAQGLDGLTVTLGEHVALDLEQSGHSLRTAVAEIPRTHFPFAFSVVDPDGRPLVYSDDIELAASLDFTGRMRAFGLKGRAIHVVPKDLEAVSALLATEDEVVTQVMGEEVPGYNERLVQRASRMMDRIIREQARQEGALDTEE